MECGLCCYESRREKNSDNAKYLCLCYTITTPPPSLSPPREYSLDTPFISFVDFLLFQVPTLNKNVLIECRYHCSVVLSPLALRVKASGEVNRERGFLPLYTPTKKTTTTANAMHSFFPIIIPKTCAYITITWLDTTRLPTFTIHMVYI